jgi:ribosomal-protein-alanine N-acetyltransferase
LINYRKFTLIFFLPVPSLILRHLQLADLPAVVALDQICLGGLWSLDGYQRELDSPNGELIVLVNTDQSGNANIIGIGTLWAIVDEAHITIVAVHPDFQGRGLGKVLLWGLLQVADQRELARATLEVAASNQVALNLYEKFGFKIAGRRKKYYEKTGDDAIIMWLSGLQHPQFINTLNNCYSEIAGDLSLQVDL